MTKTEAKNIAKDILQDAIGCAYYKLEDSIMYDIVDESDKELIGSYINKYGTAACKAIGMKYVTY